MSGEVEKEEHEESPIDALRARAAADLTDEDKKTIQNLSIRDRLMRRSGITRIETVMEDDAGDFVVETRVMTSDERYRGLKALEKMATSKKEDRAIGFGDALKTLSEIVEAIVVTEGMEGYFTGPDSTDDVVLHLFMSTLEQTMKIAGGSIESFLKQPDRPEPA